MFINDKMEIKIGDFGLATRLDFDGEKRKTICGTPNYIAPEILKGKGHSYEVIIKFLFKYELFIYLIYLFRSIFGLWEL